MGFVILVAMGVYLLISIGVVAWAISHAKKSGKSAKRWGWGVVLVMYLIPFWDWIPTVATHQFYCAKDSGFWVYKTLDQWKAENPGVMETLTTQRVWQHDYSGGRDVVHVNQRFDLEYIDGIESFLNRWRWERQFKDIKTNEVVARYVDFSTGNGHIAGEPELRFWLHSDYCTGGRDRAIKFGEFAIQFKGVEK
jgi:hypothetical protein